jgi:hypothetical protein
LFVTFFNENIAILTISEAFFLVFNRIKKSYDGFHNFVSGLTDIALALVLKEPIPTNEIFNFLDWASAWDSYIKDKLFWLLPNGDFLTNGSLFFKRNGLTHKLLILIHSSMGSFSLDPSHYMAILTNIQNNIVNNFWYDIYIINNYGLREFFEIKVSQIEAFFNLSEYLSLCLNFELRVLTDSLKNYFMVFKSFLMSTYATVKNAVNILLEDRSLDEFSFVKYTYVDAHNGSTNLQGDSLLQATVDKKLV